MLWTHTECGAPFKGVLTCDRCGKAVKGADIDLAEAEQRTSGDDVRSSVLRLRGGASR